ncbi:MAG TPA: arginase family protein [Solirubrobacteraceae bacterium]|jgi:arginase family enzyme|nr:arginase family protein [Solirubrobacteraceae bacterium]
MTGAEPVLVALHGSTEDSDELAEELATGGVDVLAEAIGRRLGAHPHRIGPAASTQGRLLEAGGQVEDALNAGALPVIVAGDGAIALGTLPTVARLEPHARVLWLDAHAAFHTPETKYGASLGEMALSGACGMWESGISGSVPGERVVLCGVRELDDPQREGLEAGELTVLGLSRELIFLLEEALEGDPVYVHLDVDVLDPETMPVSHAARDGAGFDENGLLVLLDAVGESSEVIGVEVTGFEILDGSPEATVLAADLIAGALAPLIVGGGSFEDELRAS